LRILDPSTNFANFGSDSFGFRGSKVCPELDPQKLASATSQKIQFDTYTAFTVLNIFQMLNSYVMDILGNSMTLSNHSTFANLWPFPRICSLNTLNTKFMAPNPVGVYPMDI
jgi:hypothetical protein